VVEALDLAPGADWRLHARQETWLLIIGGGAYCAGREARCGEALLVEAATVNILAGPGGLRALVAYPGPLQDRLLEAGAADLSPQACGADAAGLAA
jgi:mannose-6-phosphate isomerase